MFACCLAACETEIDVYSPPIESYSVVSILDPTRDTQYVRLSRVFQSPGDAVAYADTANTSVSGWDVWMEGNGKVWHAFEVEMPKDSGMWAAKGHHVYGFHTKWADKLIAGKRYDLFLRKPDDSNFVITAHTVIPTKPLITAPSEPTYHAPTNTYSLPSWEFTQDQDVEFKRGSGFGCEARVIITVKDEAENEREVIWGPTSIRQSPFRCSAAVDFGEMCVEIPDYSVPHFFKGYFTQSGQTFQMHDSIKIAHSVEALSKVVQVEVTTADSVLTRFLIGNDAGNYGLNMLMDKPEFSNISGPNYGIFGSINRDYQWIFMGECSKYLSGLIANPPQGCY